jgi:4-amino-4-deoxy-L-arabinose transferase-like glycosyltransferase
VVARNLQTSDLRVIPTRPAQPHAPRAGESPGYAVRLLLLVALLVVGLSFQGRRGIYESTEGRYTSVASEMLRGRDWIVPHLSDEHPHYSKPPLTYWLLAGSIRIFGRNETAVRLPGALAFILTVLVVARAGRVLTPDRPLLPACIYATFLFPGSASNVVATDNLLTLFEVAAMAAFAEHYFGAQPRRLSPAMIGWACFGLAFLTKGYPALLPMLALGLFHWLRGRHLPGKRLLDVAGVSSFILLAASWFVIVIALDPSLLRYFFGDELLGRVTGEQHRSPEWYKNFTVYGPVLLVGTFPWTLAAGRAVLGSFRELRQPRNPHLRQAPDRQDGDRLLFLGLWLTAPVVVFLLVKSRMPLYLLPQFAPLALLTAWWLCRTARPLRSVVITACLGAVAVLAVRLLAAELVSNHDSRSVARQIAALPGDVPREVVFVDVQPYRGVAFYLNAEVEEVRWSRAATGSPGSETSDIETIDDELDEREDGRLWLVPMASAARFRQRVEQRAPVRLTLLGEVDSNRPELAFVLAPPAIASVSEAPSSARTGVPGKSPHHPP